MKLRNNDEAIACINLLQEFGLLNGYEIEFINRLGAPDMPFDKAVEMAETMHLHIKVDDMHDLPVNQFFDAGARLDRQKNGFVKFCFPGGVNAIFSHGKVSQDDLMETEANRRPRPFLDHIGIDLRDETAEVRRTFDSLPATAQTLNWALASQGGPDRAVYCGACEVALKHWLYPPDEGEHIGIPIEFAYGALKINPTRMGCDLRPSNPNKVAPASTSCCGAETSIAPVSISCGTATSTEPGAVSANGRAEGYGYYQPQDLGRFGEIRRANPKLAEAFFAYTGQVMADGELTSREKSLIALAVAHALKCPYRIDSYTAKLSKMGVSEAQMSEAVHVASAMAAGITLVHSVMMMNKLDQLEARQENGASLGAGAGD